MFMPDGYHLAVTTPPDALWSVTNLLAAGPDDEVGVFVVVQVAGREYGSEGVVLLGAAGYTAGVAAAVSATVVAVARSRMMSGFRERRRPDPRQVRGSGRFVVRGRVGR
ncbi:hypothetical protein [Streptomyces sp. NPDC005262]|uniref:hypothetical protein n=1 Tax=Streptomyces sp. NPDC005262 TaxID=3364710 RepID=UPI0036CDD7FD